ncbi:MAG: high light inducible protein [Okeania sp. SIO3I5]|uniref:chlorophyll a/b-binding protein n=1 Tax=Okeania sp. SIO3I5 TaxID=2607805 RepID=UPI0013BE764C|nr:chlorophyll a/b-binding protein [Okeania sp. SIO3I5]NEQ40379.1 high light inducible protein [Okeania sp. SIO3I5]
MSENFTSSSTSEPTKKATTAKQPEPAFGWNTYAERINGRFAMVGFLILLLLEIFTNQDLFSWLGLR